jgi:predicted acylesterase/phospholipase RssA/CRP-like cAMP-binding protein
MSQLEFDMGNLDTKNLPMAQPVEQLQVVFVQIQHRAEMVVKLTTYALRVLLLGDDHLPPDFSTDELALKQYLRQLIAKDKNASSSVTRMTDFELTAHYLEVTAPRWQYLIPIDLTARALLLRKFITTYQLAYASASAIRQAFGEEELASWYESIYGETIENSMSYKPQAQSFLTTSTNIKLNALRDSLTWVELSDGDRLFEQGAPSDDGLYILVSGRVNISVANNDSVQTVAHLGQGQIVGEIGMLSDQPRTATVTATRDTVLFHLSQDEFANIARTFPDVNFALTRKIVQRLQENMRHVPVYLPRTLLLAKLTHLDEAFVPSLIEALEAYGRVLLINSANLDALSFDGALAMLDDDKQRALPITWLNEQEIHYRFVIFQSDDTVTTWTQQCISQADSTLLCADASLEPVNHPVEAHLSSDMDVDLILLYGQNSKSGQVAQWLENHDVRRHYNIKITDQNTIDRVGRFLTGNAVGLVLGGGGARGFAHIGVVRAMHELGIPIDVVGGASAGSIMAGFTATEQDVQEALTRGKNLFDNFVDYTLPFVSLASGKRLTKGLKDLFGETRIEELYVRFFCVSTNTSKSSLHVHDAGLLASAIRASASIPGIFPPVIADNEHRDVLVDGGVMNNVPVDVMQQFGVGKIIAVDLAGEMIAKRSKFNNEPALSGFQVLLNRINPLRKNRIKAPSFAGMLFRVLMMNDETQRQRLREQADAYLMPQLNHFSIFDTRKADDIQQAGYEYAMSELKTLRKELHQ